MKNCQECLREILYGYSNAQETNFVHQVVYHNSHNSHHCNMFRHSMVIPSASTKHLLIILDAWLRFVEGCVIVVTTRRIDTFVSASIRSEVTHLPHDDLRSNDKNASSCARCQLVTWSPLWHMLLRIALMHRELSISVGTPWWYHHRVPKHVAVIAAWIVIHSLQYLSSYSNSLRAGRPEIEFLWGRNFPHPSRPALGHTHSPTKWVPGLLPESKATRAWR